MTLDRAARAIALSGLDCDWVIATGLGKSAVDCRVGLVIDPWVADQEAVRIVKRRRAAGGRIGELAQDFRWLGAADEPTQGSCVLAAPAASVHAGGVIGLIEVAERLQAPGGCPWDREQTHETLKQHLIEEAYEAADAIERGDLEALIEELGDVLLQPLMHAEFSRRHGGWGIEDVAQLEAEKLVRRHPHVYGDLEVSGSSEVLQNWDQIKKSEKSADASVLGGIPAAMPALHRAHEISKRAARCGFEWPNIEAVFEKLSEELTELRAAMDEGSSGAVKAEIGDVLFTVVNIARWLKVEPEDALRAMLSRFVGRFQFMERHAGGQLSSLSPEEWDQLWNQAKETLR